MTTSVLSRIRSAGDKPFSAAEYMSLARTLKDDAEAKQRLRPVRLVLLSSFTTTLLDAYVKVEAARHGFFADVHHGGFGQFEQALQGDEWRAPEGVPEVLVVMLRVEDLHPDVSYRLFPDEGGEADPFGAIASDVLARIDATLAIFRDRSRGPALVANFAVPEQRIARVFDANQPGSLPYRFHALNRALVERVAKRAAAHVWDYAGLVASAGASAWTDARLWMLSRTPVAAANQPIFARHLTRSVRGVLTPAAKCLVLDLDNTLWGGVIGDDGVGGIQLGDDHPGRAFKELQRAALGLRDRGVLLAIASKNDAAVVHEALEKHPEMLLKREHFAAMRINWNPKSRNLREIAEELNIGIDSLVFFDDNPVERAEVAEGAPEVHVVDVPTDPSRYVDALCALHVFDAPTLTAEDRLRAQSYQAEVQRKQLEESSGSMEEFLPSLGMEVEIGAWSALTAQRITQLVGKTNQFNTTTRRLSEAELAAIHEGGLGVYWFRLSDKYGDMGLIGVCMLTAEGKDAVVHGLVLSCRAANRGIEQTMLAYLAGKARARGCVRLVGEFIPTKKNGPVAELYPRLGFERIGESEGVVRYARDLEGLAIPDYVRVRD